MIKAIKKPREVEAKQWWPPTDERHDSSMLVDRKGNNVNPPDYRQIGDLYQFSKIPGYGDDKFMFETANGKVNINPGDWILTDPETKDSWPVRKEIFDNTYDLVE
ncbi:hypothetical protein LX95_01286 [Mesonia algae]|uniref:Uncharacterized protein n=1 Tax=Mesonia algae TaxID=213248 RepID=A0A2W7I960_9FLAO|nr:hypothetical protein [Mesonia algae]PZW41605.1 hypothetical protein LX95_01286 [Mesonia algae]